MYVCMYTGVRGVGSSSCRCCPPPAGGFRPAEKRRGRWSSQWEQLPTLDSLPFHSFSLSFYLFIHCLTTRVGLSIDYFRFLSFDAGLRGLLFPPPCCCHGDPFCFGGCCCSVRFPFSKSISNLRISSNMLSDIIVLHKRHTHTHNHPHTLTHTHTHPHTQSHAALTPTHTYMQTR
eukprot:GHVU01131851.1.p2 GENE.GHVU01131851.1~~GHVU01131851.1.p2  ORF type:complete len:175 (+),score=14.67 GHVU01131851.1:1421-1945(+)